MLLVEDDERQRILLRQLLEHQGYMVEAVGTVAAAIGALRSPFDLMITDIDLGSRTTGRELVSLARSVQPNLPVVVLSARCPKEQATDQDAVTAYLHKPCTSGAIISTIRAIAPVG